MLESELDGFVLELFVARLYLAVVPLLEVVDGVCDLFVRPGQFALAVLFEVLLDQPEAVLLVKKELPALFDYLLNLFPAHLVVLVEEALLEELLEVPLEELALHEGGDVLLVDAPVLLEQHILANPLGLKGRLEVLLEELAVLVLHLVQLLRTLVLEVLHYHADDQFAVFLDAFRESAVFALSD